MSAAHELKMHFVRLPGDKQKSLRRYIGDTEFLMDLATERADESGSGETYSAKLTLINNVLVDYWAVSWEDPSTGITLHLGEEEA